MIFLCRIENFYRAKDDGIINQKFPCGKFGRKKSGEFQEREEFFRNAVLTFPLAYEIYEKVYLTRRMNDSIFSCVENVFEIH